APNSNAPMQECTNAPNSNAPMQECTNAPMKREGTLVHWCIFAFVHYSNTSPRAAARIFSAVLPPTPGISDSCSTVAAASASCDGGWLTWDLELAKLCFDFAALLFLALDVDAPAGELRGQPHVLAFLADRQRQLFVFDDDFHDPLFVIDDRHALHLCRAQRVGH